MYFLAITTNPGGMRMAAGSQEIYQRRFGQENEQRAIVKLSGLPPLPNRGLFFPRIVEQLIDDTEYGRHEKKEGSKKSHQVFTVGLIGNREAAALKIQTSGQVKSDGGRKDDQHCCHYDGGRQNEPAKEQEDTGGELQPGQGEGQQVDELSWQDLVIIYCFGKLRWFHYFMDTGVYKQASQKQPGRDEYDRQDA
jgi:hypothetical protein